VFEEELDPPSGRDYTRARNAAFTTSENLCSAGFRFIPVCHQSSTQALTGEVDVRPMAAGAVTRAKLLETRRRHFIAMVVMGPVAAAAIIVMQQLRVAARTPLWLVPAIVVGGQAAVSMLDIWFERSPTRFRMHARVGSQALVTGAVIYAIGWGPGLALGFVLVGQEGLAIVGPAAQQAVLGWNLFSLALGQLLIACGVMPSLIPTPEIHGLAVLAALGVAFSYRSLRTALVEKEEAFQLTEQGERRFRALVHSSQDLIFVFDAGVEVTYASPSCSQVLGYEPEHLIGSDKGEYVHPRDMEALRTAIAGARAIPNGRAELLFRVRRGDDEWCWVEGVATNLLDDPAVGGVVINVRDVTERLRAEEAIRHQALHDPLTGLPNRTLFNDRLEHAVGRQERTGGFVAAMIVDLDGFKNVNDSLGHGIGDELLIAVAQRLQSVLRTYETIARLGGDEFAVLIEDLQTPEHAGPVAQRLLDAMKTPLQLQDREVAIGASIGIAVAERDHDATERLLSHADAAMYRAKREGKGCYRVFEISMHAAAVARLEIEQALRVAIADDQLAVHYQPIIDLHSGSVSGFEALARWHDPDRGPIPPNVFVPIAEETNLILDLGRRILAHACGQIREWREAYPDLELGIAVNISRLQLQHPSFVSDISRVLHQAGLDPSVLTIEITESVLADNSGRVLNTLDRLRHSGMRIAIDDFGTGYSSFATLAELPIDILKIDKRFIDNVTHGNQGRGFVNAIIELAKTLELETIAEGVEYADQVEVLRELGSTHMQGCVHSPALSIDQAQQYLEKCTKISNGEVPAAQIERR
jgi:diguanylate cyclase (GGDEF)-like protein/PAS domain S-box-containing protein